jgi:DNA-directed RNA polymerase specialized sigma24 family protein
MSACDFFSRIGIYRLIGGEMRGLHSGQDKAGRSREEIAQAIRELTPVDWIRLKNAANRYARRQMGPQDILQEAFARAIDGRVCPVHVTVVKFLAEAMRSIAHGEGEKVEHRLVLVSAGASSEADRQADAYPDPGLNAEQLMVSEESVVEMRTAILGLFADDDIGQIIAEGMMDGLEGEELRELCGLDATGYNSKRRLVRRRIDNAYPEGWKL